jgi:hypothetical protein
MNLLRIVASMAWADGELATEEVDLMLDRFCRLFAGGTAQQELQQELRDYVMQNIPLDELIHQLESQAEKELILQLGYEVIASSSRTPEEPKINAEEAAAYQKLLQLLELSEETVKRIEAEASATHTSGGVVENLAHKLEQFIKG